ncbi:hypothetical protein TH606_10565 [Thermodesulfatator autotrophicus]|uniref:Uncharacterized protein n=1 Tax=Thermodesulfatator autotrophicus TaxID=1795632 RepID=A0A177E473_9BACT|nr:hypothetical protein TH606_10565 [Thermodesulfatator autotrophicus]
MTLLKERALIYWFYQKMISCLLSPSPLAEKSYFLKEPERPLQKKKIFTMRPWRVLEKQPLFLPCGKNSKKQSFYPFTRLLFGKNFLFPALTVGSALTFAPPVIVLTCKTK